MFGAHAHRDDVTRGAEEDRENAKGRKRETEGEQYQAPRGRTRHVRCPVDFDVPMSPVTALALSIVLPAALVLLVIATVAVELVAKGAAIRNAWNAIAIGLALTCLATYIVGVSLPLLQLIEGLS
jgi:hypothetical protein